MSGILIVADQVDGALRDITGELVTAAMSIKVDIGGPVALAVLTDGDGGAVEQAAFEGIDQLLHCDVGSQHFDPIVHEEVICQVGAALRPRIVLFAHSANGMASAPAVAARLGSGFASDVFGLRTEGTELLVTRGAYGNKLNVELGFSGKGIVVLTVRGGTFKPARGGAAVERVVQRFDLPALPHRSRHVEYIPPQSAGVDVSKAEFILAIGRGVQEEKNVARFQDLAQRLGATFACSRPVVDAGWLPKPHQIGQSGKVASNCKLYIALGISGAVQHLYGMKHVETIIAINTDESAPIYGVATYGAAIDLFAFADALERQFN